MSKYGGYMGRVLEIDLTTQTVRDYPWSDRERELYIGGKIMAARILYDNLTGKETAFSEENPVVIATGPLTGTGAPSSARFDISALSPQTGYISSSNCGGSFGFHLKRAGLDAVILRGRCAERTWLHIENGSVSFQSADDLWGTKVTECQNRLAEKLRALRGKDTRFGKLCIGPAGENLVLYSAVCSDERAAGRTGMGAVLGWKNLKAVTVCGDHEVPVSDPAATKEWCKKWIKYLKNHPITGDQLPRLGTAGLVSSMQRCGILATRNYAQGQNPDFEAVSGEALAEQYNLGNKGCLTCPIRCARTVTVEGEAVKGPELETLGLLGGGILNNDLYKILKWNKELDELGMDTISAANTLSYAMEANERGLWDNGLRFGETESISGLWDDIAHRRGVGAELAEGSRRLSEKYGGAEFAIQSKGLELAAYEPRRAVGQGLGYAVSNRGGCHINGGYLVILEGLGLNADSQTPRAKADFAMMFQDLLEMISATGQCIFTSYALFPAFLIRHPNGFITTTVNKLIPHLGGAVRLMNKCPRLLALHLPIFHHTRMLQKAVGMRMTLGKYMLCGERGFNLERTVNARFGVSAEKDTLPKRLTDVPQDGSDSKKRVPLETMKKTYYRARGWDENGIPTERTLRRLKIR